MVSEEVFSQVRRGRGHAPCPVRGPVGGGGCVPPVWSQVQWGRGAACPGPRSGGGGGKYLHGTDPSPWTRQTENITFPHTLCVGGNNGLFYKKRQIVTSLSHTMSSAMSSAMLNDDAKFYEHIDIDM